MTQYDVITVAAMEGVGVAAAMQQQQAISGVHQALPTCFHSTGWSSPMAAAVRDFILERESLRYTFTSGMSHCLMRRSLRDLFEPLVAALEAAGALRIDLHLVLLAGTSGVPYVFVRANSDYTYGPVKRAADGRAWVPAKSAVPANNTLGYKFAIATSSTAVLTMLQRRCLASASAGALDLCRFSPLQV